MTDLMERVNREDREWREARLHFYAHNSWLGPDECVVCIAIYPTSPHVNLTPWARDHLGGEDFRAIAARAESLNARVGALYSWRHHGWWTTATTPERRVKLRASGDLFAVLTGLLDDLEALL